MKPPLPLTNVPRLLLCWYDHHKRDLPWRRREDDAYAQLVAEVMLQQTQVATVLPYYERFMKRFPTARALAEASIDDVLPWWAGLGYYSRVRNLHAATRKIMDEHGGRVPDTVEELMGLPGVGRYTAGAVASIAYGVRAPVLDGNVGRVLMRLTGMEADPKSQATRAALWRLAEELLPAKRCGDFNQAMMELGATVCTPQTPDCLQCPLRMMCKAYQEGSTERIPPPARRTRVVPAAVVVAAISRDDKMLFVQRPDTGLWAGLWELPSEPVAAGETIAAARHRLRDRLPKGVRISAKPFGTVVRQLTHREITFHVYRGSAPANGVKNVRPAQWLSPADAAPLGLSRACEAILRLCE